MFPCSFYYILQLAVVHFFLSHTIIWSSKNINLWCRYINHLPEGVSSKATSYNPVSCLISINLHNKQFKWVHNLRHLSHNHICYTVHVSTCSQQEVQKNHAPEAAFLEVCTKTQNDPWIKCPACIQFESPCPVTSSKFTTVCVNKQMQPLINHPYKIH